MVLYLLIQCLNINLVDAMDRKRFLRLAALGALSPNFMSLQKLYQHSRSFPDQEALPVLFLGHGNPMNAIEENEFVEGFRKTALQLPTPRAVICISAHWETQGTRITAMPQPKTIHDFGGFPRALFEVEYPAPGDPKLAQELKDLIEEPEILLDHEWGLDHGAWSVIKHLYPNANIPVLQLSIDYSKGPQYHYDLARALSVLRRKGVLFIGSGNMVHNLRLTDWHRLNDNFGFDWALEAQSKMRNFLEQCDDRSLIDFRKQGQAFDLAIPSTEHYIPLLYSLGLRDKKENLRIFNDEPVGGALTMTSVQYG